LAITPLQDVLSLPTTARMNLPGVGHGNWRWRANDEAGIAAGLERLSELTTLYARV
jgi:4-alpha-glucanotransferase